VAGEVVHPGTYGIQPGERLSSVIQRAGGFSPNAYPYGAVFERVELRELEEKNRADLIERMKAEWKNVKLVPDMDQDDQARAKASVLQYQKSIANLESSPPAGRLVIHVSSEVKRWANTSADIQVRAGEEGGHGCGGWIGIQPDWDHIQAREKRWLVSQTGRRTNGDG
jgi:hypothetical protein